MPFNKNTSGNPKGKPKGTLNKVTKLNREFIQSILDNQTIKIETELSNLSGKDYLIAIFNLFEYTMPKLNRTEIVNYEDKRQGYIECEIE